MAGLVSVLIALAVGVPFGLAAGYFGGWTDSCISRATEALLAIPFLILAIALAAFLGPSLMNAMIAIGVSAAPKFIRLTRGQVLAVKSEDYVQSARALGASDLRIIARHVFPNVMPPLIVQATITIATAIIAEASLSFLGLGLQPPNPSWGSMLNTAKNFMTQAPWMSIFPDRPSSWWCWASTCWATGCATRWIRARKSNHHGNNGFQTRGQVNDLTVRFKTPDRVVEAVRNVSFHVDRGETLAIVGESGSGKSVTSLALMRLVEYGGGRIVNGGMLLRRRSGECWTWWRRPTRRCSARGADVAMIFQEPMTSLNPSFTAGNQIAEALRLHQGLDAAAARAETLRMLERVRIPEARAILDRYPHQLSGGMRQRVMIAMALSCKPQLLIADEPTTALDVTIQAQIPQLIRQLQEMDMGVIFITHDMGVVAEVADRVLVMYRGDKVEEGGSDAVSPGRSTPTRARCCRRCRAWGHARHGRARAISAAARGRRGQGRAASVGSSPGPCRPALDRAARERPGAEGARPDHHLRHHRRHPGPGAEARARGREGQLRPVPRRDAVAGG